MMKKIISAVFLVGALSVSAFAGDMGACSADHVTVPCAARGWDIGLQALYLQPAYDVDRVLVVNDNGTIRELNSAWGWGYRLEGSYHFSTGNDVNIDWTHYDVDSDFANMSGLTPLGVSPFTLHQENQFDQVNLVLGQHSDVGLLKNIRFYGGLQYASIHSDHARTYEPTPFAVLLDVSGIRQYNDADFNGVGPTLGMDYSYDLFHGLSLTANTGMSVLYGTSRNQTGFVFSPTGLTVNVNYGTRQTVVPSLEAKLGLNYARELAQGTLNLVGGYQILNYFHPLSIVSVGDSDFGLSGPYIGLNWLGYL